MAYGMSKMTVVSEMQSYKAYQKMEMVEWLEFIGRISDLKYRGTEMEKTISLAQKIEYVLDDLFQGFGL